MLFAVLCLRLRPHYALLASRLPPAVDADAHAPALLALRLPPRVDAHRCTATTPLALRPFPIMQARGVFSLHFAVLALRLPKVVGLWCCLVLADSSDAALSQFVFSAQIRLRGPVIQGHRIALVFCHLMHPLALCRHFLWDAFAKGKCREIGRDQRAGPFTEGGGLRPHCHCTHPDDPCSSRLWWWAGC